MPKPVRASSWQDMRRLLASKNKIELLNLIRDLYVLTTDNKDFVHYVSGLVPRNQLLPGGGTRGKEGDRRMSASRTPLDLGIAFARMYLEQAFGYGNVECIDRPDEEDTQRGTRSFWIENQGRQRIYFATGVLEDKRDPRRVLQTLTGWE